MSLLGTPQRRLEGGAKVTGATRFAADAGIAALTHARLVLSPYPHARIRSVDLTAAASAPGVLAALSGRDLPELDVPGPDLPLARERVFYAGQPIAVVVAESEAAAADAAALIDVDYEALPAVLDPFEAMREGAPNVLESKESALDDAGAHGTATAAQTGEEKPANVSTMARFERGNAHAAIAAAEVVVEGRYRLAPVHQGFLEPHISIARPEPDGGVTIWTSTQGSFLARATTARMLGETHGRIRIVPMTVGGGFGGKICLLEPLVALLSRRTGRAVQLQLTRTEEFMIGRAAPGCTIDIKLGASRDGSLSGLWARVVFDNGAGPGGLAGLAGIMLGGTYRVADWDYIGYDVATNKTPVGAYRAPGATQAFFALESSMDELATMIGMDPIELRLRNACREGDPKGDNTVWPQIGLVECLERARQYPLYTAPRAAGEGVGVAAGGWGGGREPSAAACKVEADGTLTLHIGSVDISGTDTALAMIAAETFGTDLARVRIEKGDTGVSPYAGMAGGSKIIYTVGPAVQAAAAEARKQLLEIAAEELEAAPEDLVIEDGSVRVSGVPGRSMEVGHLAGLALQFGGRYPPVQGQGRAAITAQSPMFTVHLARVRVDRETGAYSVTGYAAIQDVGHALNPPEVGGQVHGGVVQGLGRSLGEELIHDGDGQLRTVTFLDYPLPSIDQIPDIGVELVEIPSPHGPFGAKGVGEPPAVPGPAVIANAIKAATGVRVREVPVPAAALIAGGD
jgi:CO/xanthine dehydrogenase Mo-binding subunit